MNRHVAPLPAEDVEGMAVAAYLTGKDDESAELWERAHREWLAHGDPARAVICAFWLAYGLLTRGEKALGGGWPARAGRLLDETGTECAASGYLLLPMAMGHVADHDYADASALAASATELGKRFGDRDLVALGQHVLGRTLIRLGRDAEGIALLDELMVQIAAEDLSPVVVGMVYCAAIEGCQEIFDIRRAREWTAALTRWCAVRPDLETGRSRRSRSAPTRCRNRRSSLSTFPATGCRRSRRGLGAQVTNGPLAVAAGSRAGRARSTSPPSGTHPRLPWRPVRWTAPDSRGPGP